MADEQGATGQSSEAARPAGARRPARRPVSQGKGQPARKRKKPNFNKPLLVAGIFLGIVSGLPFLNFLNMIIFAWAWIAGIIAAKVFSKIYPRIELSHGAICGAIAGLLGAVIATPLSVTSSWVLTKYAYRSANAHEILTNVSWMSGKKQANLLNDVLLRWFPRPHHAFAIMSWNTVDEFGFYVDKKGTRLSKPTAEDLPGRITAKEATVRIVLHFLFLEVGFFLFGALGGLIGASIYAYKPPPAPEEGAADVPADAGARGSPPTGDRTPGSV